MATLYNQVSSNNRKAFFLIFFFLIFVIFLGWIFSWFFNDVNILYFAVLFSTVMSFMSYYNSDKMILSISGASEIQKNDNPELYRVVENLAITAGMPTPKVYILEEVQPNAFATGRDEKHAVVAVTRGLLQKLEKRELEAVIAHEIAHIKGKDILVGSIVVVLVGIISILSDIFLRSMFWGHGDNDNKNPIFLILAIIGMILAPIAATIIQLAISRKQEFKADANGALLTRDPEALASALIKISSDRTPLNKINNATAHLYVASPYKKKVEWYEKLFMTHPPVEERVNALRQL
ncbi:MAG TPA: M48 family metallopeptidase [Candidatus Pacearchaeota archaeon]|nr:M48 family metallopeptidase [Candidatus Pacearchaeota archaeon]